MDDDKATQAQVEAQAQGTGQGQGGINGFSILYVVCVAGLSLVLVVSIVFCLQQTLFAHGCKRERGRQRGRPLRPSSGGGGGSSRLGDVTSGMMLGATLRGVVGVGREDGKPVWKGGRWRYVCMVCLVSTPASLLSLLLVACMGRADGCRCLC